MAKPYVKKDYKQQEIAKIHIAKQQLGMDDDTYRELLTAIGGVKSSKDLTALGRAKLLGHFKAAGFKATNPHPKRPNTADTKPQLGKIEALLADMGLPWDYALAIAKQMYKKDRLEFCTARELGGVITALVKKTGERGRRMNGQDEFVLGKISDLLDVKLDSKAAERDYLLTVTWLLVGLLHDVYGDGFCAAMFGRWANEARGGKRLTFKEKEGAG